MQQNIQVSIISLTRKYLLMSEKRKEKHLFYHFVNDLLKDNCLESCTKQVYRRMSRVKSDEMSIGVSACTERTVVVTVGEPELSRSSDLKHPGW